MSTIVIRYLGMTPLNHCIRIYWQQVEIPLTGCESVQIPEIAERGQGEHEDDEGEGVADHLQDPAHARHQHLDLKKVF